MPSYQSFHSILWQRHTVYGGQTAWRRILWFPAASLQLASEEKTTDSTVKNKSQHFCGEAETNTMLDILGNMDIKHISDMWRGVGARLMSH